MGIRPWQVATMSAPTLANLTHARRKILITLRRGRVAGPEQEADALPARRRGQHLQSWRDTVMMPLAVLMMLPAKRGDVYHLHMRSEQGGPGITFKPSGPWQLM